ncbi:MAG: hypothetical protein IT380_09930 [Myxococcales bacterium]|nr:hypothetical protein [Myxococcales bacterium]
MIVLARQAVGDEADDAAGSFLETTVRATKNGSAASAEALLDLPDDELRKVIAHRIRQHAVQQRPLWGLTKALRGHVAEALEHGLPPAPLAPPPGLLHGERLSSSLVARATSFFLDAEPELERTPAAITKRLIAVYHVPPAREVEAAGFDDDLRRHRDARVLAADIREVLGPEFVSVLRHRLAGLGFEAIAEREGIAVSTAHARHQAAVERLRAFNRQVRSSHETARVALLYATAA